MVRFLKVIFIFIITMGITGCKPNTISKPDRGTEDNSVAEYDKIIESQDGENEVMAYEGNVDNYIRNYQRYEGKTVSIIGNWYINSVHPFGTSGYVDLDIDANKFDTSDMQPLSFVIVTGESMTTPSGPRIKVSKLRYINPQTERYWGTSTILDSSNFNDTVNDLIEYECIVYVTEDSTSYNKLNVVGTGSSILTLGSLEYNSFYRVLLTDVRNSNNKYYARCIEYVKL